jgi:hypothetical protein
VIGTIVPEYESGGKDLRPLMQDICRNPESFERNINENMRRGGERVWVSWTNRAVADEHGEVVEVFSVGSDITERSASRGGATPVSRTPRGAGRRAHKRVAPGDGATACRRKSSLRWVTWSPAWRTN